MKESSDHDNMACGFPGPNSEKDLLSGPQVVLYQKSSSIEEMNINDNHFIEDEPYSAPVEILSEFLSTLMARNYKSALYYCKLILLYEPNNEVVKCFYPVIKEKMELDNYDSDEYGDTDENSSTKSGSSTEYFSSTSVGTEHMSSSSSLNSEEEESSSD